MHTPAGPEWTLDADGYQAVITSVGASLRRLTWHGRDLVVPFAADELRPVYRGALVAPWPNRIADGRYRFGGVDHQLPITEASTGSALHGLTTWARWELVSCSTDRLDLQVRPAPQDGYPFDVELLATFRLSAEGLSTTLTATNRGPDAPYGSCPHPYLTAGSGTVDSWHLELPAATRLEVDERLLPTRRAPVGEIDNDFRTGAVVGPREIDHAFTDLTPGEDGRTVVTVHDLAAGTGTALSWDSSWADWVQIHTADRPEPTRNRVGLAVEPMSCPPNAFNGNDSAVLLPAGGTHVAEWTISALDRR